MSTRFIFWLLMLLWLALGFWAAYPAFGWAYAGNFLLFALLFLLGWKAFGFPVEG